MKARILSKERVYFEGEIKSALLPTKEGQIEILENHAPIFALLKEGKISKKDKIVVLVTGNGLKDVESAKKAGGEILLIEPSLTIIS